MSERLFFGSNTLLRRSVTVALFFCGATFIDETEVLARETFAGAFFVVAFEDLTGVFFAVFVVAMRQDYSINNCLSIPFWKASLLSQFVQIFYIALHSNSYALEAYRKEVVYGHFRTHFRSTDFFVFGKSFLGTHPNS